MKCAVLCENPANVDYVYGAKRLERLATLCDLLPGIYSGADVAAGKLIDVEVLFSTWGMPCLSEEELDRMPKLRAVFYAAGATDSFVRPLLARNVKVMSAWQMNAIPVAEFCVAQIVLALKGYFRNSREVRSTQSWSRENVFCGPGCYGETVALIGAGAISTLVCRMLETYHLKVIVVPSRPERRTISLEEAFRTAFVVSNHLPNREDNIGVLNGRLFESMRPGAVFINTGRGAQVNEPELIDVLRRRPDLTALLDVTCPEPPEKESPFFHLPNVQLSSHIAGSINDEVGRMADCAIGEFEKFAVGKEPDYLVCESMLLTSR